MNEIFDLKKYSKKSKLLNSIKSILTAKRGNENTQDVVIIFKPESLANDFASE